MSDNIYTPAALDNGAPPRDPTDEFFYSEEDLRRFTNDVARILFGTPNRAMSRGSDIRYNARGSLSINIVKGVWRDYETGEGGGVLALIERETGLRGDDRFRWLREQGFKPSGDRSKPKGNGSGEPPKKRVNPKLGKLATTYPYPDASGTLLFEVARFDPKDFRPRQPDGNGSWVWNLQGLDDKLVVYRLPEIIEAISLGRRIYICEGEKDTHAAVEIGLDATCNQGGCGGGWRAQYNETFRDADVVIVPHNDDAGRKHAEKIAASLSGVASKIRILKLWESWKECPLKADFYDWRQVPGHTREQLDALVDALPDYEPIGDPPPDPALAAAFALDDFRAYMPAHQYICLPTGELWPASSVDATVPRIGKVKASAWLDRNRPVSQMTWVPGMPTIIHDRTVTNGGWDDKRGYAVFNLYKPPTITPGDAAAADRWVDHVRKVYPDDAEHLLNYFAHRVQKPHDKINHGLVLGGTQGVGKDTMIEPVKRAVGPWNVHEISPQQVLGRFNGFVKSVILRISEARDLGEMNRFTFYEHMKAILVTPPDVLRCDEKNLREHSVFNVMGVIITSNRKDSFYLPPDDRRHYVCWTDLTQADFTESYWKELWNWYDAGGDRHVAACLATRDLTNFDPKAPPPKTDAFWQIVETNRAPENSDLADALDELGNPDAVTLGRIRMIATGDLLVWIADRRNARQIPHRMSECGYVAVRNPTREDGYWKINGSRQPIYAKADLSIRDRHAAAAALQ
jgi:uncharacterized protein DUF5906